LFETPVVFFFTVQLVENGIHHFGPASNVLWITDTSRLLCDSGKECAVQPIKQ